MRLCVASDPDPRKTAVAVESLRRVSDIRPNVEFAPERRFVCAVMPGMTMYTDGDVLFRRDPRELFRMVSDDPRVVVACVAHPRYDAPPLKKGGEPNEWYERKNWSSMFVSNGNHPAHRRLWGSECIFGQGCTFDPNLTPRVLSHPDNLPFLHRFGWLTADEELFRVPREWNVLAGIPEHEEVDDPAIVHFTHGTPNESHALPSRWDEEWLAVAETINGG